MFCGGEPRQDVFCGGKLCPYARGGVGIKDGERDLKLEFLFVEAASRYTNGHDVAAALPNSESVGSFIAEF